MKPHVALILVMTLALALFAAAAAPGAKAKEVILGTTTSVVDTGLLDTLLPLFERQSGIRVKPLAVGSGEAMALGRRGEVDLLFVHSPADEETFIKEGYGLKRYTVMYNDFVLLGLPDDPAGAAKEKSITGAFRRIAAAKSPFISRSDNSGTHRKELSLWRAAGIEPGGDWYLRTGQGMGASLTVADEKGAYVLCDRATFTARKASLRLEVLFASGKELRNWYTLIPVSPKKFSTVNYDAAMALVRFLTEKRIQKLIGDFRGGGLFTPCWKK